MPEPMFRCRRGIYLFALPLAHVETALAAWSPGPGKKQRVRLALSAEYSGWRLLGVEDVMSDEALFELAWSLFGGDDGEDFDLEKLAAELDVPDDSIVVVQFVAGSPEQTWYALHEANDSFDVLFTGRRDDGKGLRIDVVADSIKTVKQARGFTQPVVEYLRSRGVPENLLPGADGLAVVPEQQRSIAVNVE